MKTVICADSFRWLPANRDQGSIVTSLPDASEIGITNLDEYEVWVRRAATEIFLSASEGCPVIFVQTDRRKGGRQFSKAALLMDIAQEQGWFLLWHKIELTAEVGKSNLYRPTFRNMLCFGKGKMRAGQATPDVIPKSKQLYDMAFGFEAAKVCVKFCKNYTNRVCDSFCGHGTVLHVAEEFGMDSVGVDINPAVCEIARHFTWPDRRSRLSGKAGVRRATLADLTAIYRHFQARRDVFPHVRQDAIKRRIEARQCIYQDGVIITYLPYRKATAVGNVRIPAGAIMLYQILNSAQFNGSGRKVFCQFVDEVVKPSRGDLYLSVRRDNTVATRFYERRGMKVAGAVAWSHGSIPGLIFKLSSHN